MRLSSSLPQRFERALRCSSSVRRDLSAHAPARSLPPDLSHGVLAAPLPDRAIFCIFRQPSDPPSRTLMVAWLNALGRTSRAVLPMGAGLLLAPALLVGGIHRSSLLGVDRRGRTIERGASRLPRMAERAAIAPLRCWSCMLFVCCCAAGCRLVEFVSS